MRKEDSSFRLSSKKSRIQRKSKATRIIVLPHQFNLGIYTQELAKLDKFAAIILDDIGYVQHDRDEMEVLFTFLAERYERKSVLISTNLVFSEHEREKWRAAKKRETMLCQIM